MLADFHYNIFFIFRCWIVDIETITNHFKIFDKIYLWLHSVLIIYLDENKVFLH